MKTLVTGGIFFCSQFDLAEEFQKHCPNVKSWSALDWRESCSYWPDIFGKQLEVLETVITEEFSGFGVGTTNIRELMVSIDLSPVREVDFTYRGGQDICFEDFWETAGATLEVLTELRTEHSLICEINTIQRHCRNLKSISLIEQDKEDIAGITALLASYGAQLEYAYLREMNIRQIRTVANACPNARFRVGFYDTPISPACLRIHGPRLEKASIHKITAGHKRSSWKNAWGKCINLRRSGQLK